MGKIHIELEEIDAATLLDLLNALIRFNQEMPVDLSQIIQEALTYSVKAGEMDVGTAFAAFGHMSRMMEDIAYGSGKISILQYLLSEALAQGSS